MNPNHKTRDGVPFKNRLAYSIDELADHLGVCRDMIYRAIHSGALAARKLGRRTIIPAASVAAYLDSLEHADAKSMTHSAPKKAMAARARRATESADA